MAASPRESAAQQPANGLNSPVASRDQQPSGGGILLKAAVAMLIAWLLGVLGLYDAGNLVHVLLLAGLMFLLIGFLKARDAAAARHPDSRS